MLKKPTNKRVPKARRYTIEMKDAKTNKAVIHTAVDLTDDGRRVVAAQLMRLAGGPEGGAAGCFLDQVAREPDKPV